MAVYLRQEELMTKWEYTSCRMTKIDAANAIGQEEWELVAVDDEIGYFKRPLLDEEDTLIGYMAKASRAMPELELAGGVPPLGLDEDELPVRG